MLSKLCAVGPQASPVTLKSAGTRGGSGRLPGGPGCPLRAVGGSYGGGASNGAYPEGYGNGARPGRSSNGASPGTKYGAPKRGSDYLYDLGRVDYNTNVTSGQNSTHLDSLFTGNFLGHDTDIADGSLRAIEFRTYNNVVGDYYVAPRFMDQIALHMAKNYLVDQDALPGLSKVPLILGVWGPKGTGKSFQTELSFRQMGILPVIMSAGELEHEWAGTPGKMIRERYRRASELSRVRGVMTCLLINDLDAGVGRFSNTQVTVNNQIVIGTLMNICDHPNSVSIGGSWEKERRLRRVPIIVTGNDFSTIYAPLIRDGRMEKFYWDPRKNELVDILFQMYKDDGLTKSDMLKLIEAFPRQPLDFYGALRAATYDNQIRDWIKEDIVGDDISGEADMSILGERLLKKEFHPEFEPINLTLADLVKEATRLAEQQQFVNDHKLSKEYMKDLGKASGGSIIGFQG